MKKVIFVCIKINISRFSVVIFFFVVAVVVLINATDAIKRVSCIKQKIKIIYKYVFIFYFVFLKSYFADPLIFCIAVLYIILLY